MNRQDTHTLDRPGFTRWESGTVWNVRHGVVMGDSLSTWA